MSSRRQYIIVRSNIHLITNLRARGRSPQEPEPEVIMNKFFGQILQIFSKNEFYEAVKETKADKGAIGQHNDKGQKYRG
jgi:hypothetical protein